jgi:very-short-patch-repair endonuclease
VGFHHRRASTPSGSHPSVTHHACSQRMMRAAVPSLAGERGDEGKDRGSCTALPPRRMRAGGRPRPSVVEYHVLFLHSVAQCTPIVTMDAHAVPHRRQMTMRARSLRRDSTDAEKRLWSALRDRRLEGVRFRRQVVVGRYITDFCAASPKLIIEIDGVQHEDQKIYDAVRTQYLQSQGYSVLRFWNGDVLVHLSDVLNTIADEIRKPQV